RTTINSEVTADANLVARWGMAEGTGTTITSTAAASLPGNFGGSPVWTSGMVFSNNALPTVAFTSPAEGSEIPAGDVVDIQVSATDPDGSVAKVDYYRGGELVHTATAAPFSFPYTMESGNRRFTATITDNMGGTTFSTNGLLLT